ncbi:MAG: 2,3,4,5-tetrahydropyridine-2,6-dicarboxylate N-succinyltransferase, partial [Alphaproteobacteria bacterium]|nr:2,3,4,5-tetrahydropyridine-2,6-dicarboxylate N-succinyltransferase [Alphaproteobacteria bacterium]
MQQIIESAFEKRTEINLQTTGEIRDAVNQALALLNTGKIRVCEKIDGVWRVHQWIKKAILLSFRLNDNKLGVGGCFDKVPLKFANWSEEDFRRAGFRALPGAVVRYSSFIEKNT